MKLLVVGLGSMGKRRVLNLPAIGGHELAGFDPREDRRTEARSKYGIDVYDDFEEAVRQHAPQVLVISTPPDLHMTYAYRALEGRMHVFIEASVVEADRILELGERSRSAGLVMLPSCTMHFYPGPAMVREALREGLVGSPLMFTYPSGQYLAD